MIYFIVLLIQIYGDEIEYVEDGIDVDIFSWIYFIVFSISLPEGVDAWKWENDEV